MPISTTRLREVLAYSPLTGEFRWKVDHSRVRRGDIAGTPQHNGYWSIKVDQQKYMAHVLAWVYITGEWPQGEIDHGDENKRNNAISNLSDVTRAQNQQNQSKSHRDNRTGYRGVTMHARSVKYHARIQKDGREKSLGYFATIEEAAAAYKAAKEEIQ